MCRDVSRKAGAEMSQRQQFFLRSPVIALNAARFIQGLPTDNERPLVVEIKPMTRSLEQNARLWAMLTDLSEQVTWHGLKLSAEDWKHVMTAGLKSQRAVPGIDGGFVVLGQSTSKMSKADMIELQELIAAFGAEHGVRFGVEG